MAASQSSRQRRMDSAWLLRQFCVCRNALRMSHLSSTEPSPPDVDAQADSVKPRERRGGCDKSQPRGGSHHFPHDVSWAASGRSLARLIAASLYTAHRGVMVSIGTALRPLSYIERHESFEVRRRGRLTSVIRRARMRPEASTYVGAVITGLE